MKKLLLTGSRSHPDGGRVRDFLLNKIIPRYDEILLIHGDCSHPRQYPLYQSVDWVGQEVWMDVYGKNWEQYVFVHPPKRDKKGKATPRDFAIRNQEMVNILPDLVLAFPYGESKGTNMTIEMARRRDLNVHVVDFYKNWGE